MKNSNKLFIIIISSILLTACSPVKVVNQGILPGIKDRPALSDLNHSGEVLYFLVQGGERTELKKRDLKTNEEALIRLFQYAFPITKFAVSADEKHIAFMGKEDKSFILYITDMGGERLIEVEDAALSKNDHTLNADNFILKRVGLKHKFFFADLSYMDCGGELLSFVSHHVVLSCEQATEIIPDEKLLVIETDEEGNAVLSVTDYEDWNPEALIKLPFRKNDIKNLELLDERTVRVSTEKEFVDVRFKSNI